MATHEHRIFWGVRDASHIVDDARNPLCVHEPWIVVALDGVVHTFCAFHANAVEVDPSWRVVGNHHIEVVGAQSACLLDALLHVKNILLEKWVEVVAATARIRQIHDDGALLRRSCARSCEIVGDVVVTGRKPARCHEHEQGDKPFRGMKLWGCHVVALICRYLVCYTPMEPCGECVEGYHSGHPLLLFLLELGNGLLQCRNLLHRVALLLAFACHNSLGRMCHEVVVG